MTYIYISQNIEKKEAEWWEAHGETRFVYNSHEYGENYLY